MVNAFFCWETSRHRRRIPGRRLPRWELTPVVCTPVPRGEVVYRAREPTSVGKMSNDANLIEYPASVRGDLRLPLHLRKNRTANPRSPTTSPWGRSSRSSATWAPTSAPSTSTSRATYMPDGTSGFVTFRLPLPDYEVRKPDGNLHIVQCGVPRQGQILRLAVTPTSDPRSTVALGAVARSGDRADVVATAKDGKVPSVRWEAEYLRPQLAPLAPGDHRHRRHGRPRRRGRARRSTSSTSSSPAATQAPFPWGAWDRADARRGQCAASGTFKVATSPPAARSPRCRAIRASSTSSTSATTATSTPCRLARQRRRRQAGAAGGRSGHHRRARRRRAARCRATRTRTNTSRFANYGQDLYRRLGSQRRLSASGAAG